MKILKRYTAFKYIIPFLSIFLYIFLFPGLTEAQEMKTVEMEGNDQLQFTVTKIEAEPGQKIKVILTTISDYPKVAMAHNFVLLKAEADATEVANTSARHPDNEYIAPDMKDQILAYTGLAGDGETVEVTFTAPGKPGEYEYVCTFPGHYAAGMKGTLVVK